MKKVVLIIFAVMFFSSFVLAGNCVPTIPKTYAGEIIYNNKTLSGTYEVSAKMGNEIIGIGIANNGEYSIDISPCSNGDFSFYVGNIQAKEFGNYSGMADWGIETILDLRINSTPTLTTLISTCDNGIVEPWEECDGTNLNGRAKSDCGTNWQGTISCASNCKIDYSDCESVSSNSGGNSGGGSSSGGSSGGGGGGGSSSKGSSTQTTTNLDNTNAPIVLSENYSESDKENSNNNAPLTGNVIANLFSEKNRIFTIIGGITILGLGILAVRASRKKKVVENKEENSEVKEEKMKEGKEEGKD